MGDVSTLTIKLFGGGVFLDDLKMDGSNLKITSLFLDVFESLPSPAESTMRFAQVELIEEGVASKKLQAVAEREHHVTDGDLLLANQPSSSEGMVTEEVQQGA